MSKVRPSPGRLRRPPSPCDPEPLAQAGEGFGLAPLSPVPAQRGTSEGEGLGVRAGLTGSVRHQQQRRRAPPVGAVGDTAGNISHPAEPFRRLGPPAGSPRSPLAGGAAVWSNTGMTPSHIDEQSEFRQDIISGRWVIFAPERARRPQRRLRTGLCRQFVSSATTGAVPVLRDRRPIPQSWVQSEFPHHICNRIHG